MFFSLVEHFGGSGSVDRGAGGEYIGGESSDGGCGKEQRKQVFD